MAANDDEFKVPKKRPADEIADADADSDAGSEKSDSKKSDSKKSADSKSDEGPDEDHEEDSDSKSDEDSDEDAWITCYIPKPHRAWVFDLHGVLYHVTNNNLDREIGEYDDPTHSVCVYVENSDESLTLQINKTLLFAHRAGTEKITVSSENYDGKYYMMCHSKGDIVRLWDKDKDVPEDTDEWTYFLWSAPTLDEAATRSGLIDRSFQRIMRSGLF